MFVKSVKEIKNEGSLLYFVNSILKYVKIQMVPAADADRI